MSNSWPNKTAAKGRIKGTLVFKVKVNIKNSNLQFYSERLRTIIYPSFHRKINLYATVLDKHRIQYIKNCSKINKTTSCQPLQNSRLMHLTWYFWDWVIGLNARLRMGEYKPDETE